MQVKVKAKKCRVCRVEFLPNKPMQRVCSPECALSLAQSVRAKQEKREIVRRKRALKSRSEWQKEAQVSFNAYIRARDVALPCISCGRFHEGQWHAGHFLSTGARPNLRFHEDNVHKQCQPCNTHLSGNLINYRVGLIERIGVERVEALECDHEPRKYTVDELKEIKARYAQLRKGLE